MRKGYLPSIALLHALFTGLALTLGLGAKGADTLRTASRVSGVTVFASGAQVERKVALKVPAGKHFVRVQGLPLETDPASLQVTGPDGCTIYSVKHLAQVQAGIKKTAEYQRVEKDIEKEKARLKSLKQESGVYDQEEAILLDNSQLGGRARGVTIAEIREAADFYRSRLNEIREARMALELEAEAGRDRIKDLHNALGVLEADRQSLSSEALITLHCREALDDTLGLTYYCPSAGWTPTYDLRVRDVASPLILGYNAHVYQSTGEDWTQVRLTLSSGDPRLSGERPELGAWRIGSSPPVVRSIRQEGSGELRGTCRDAETDEPLPFVNLVISQDGRTLYGTTTDFDGKYILKPIAAGTYDMEVSFVGFQSQSIRGVSIRPDKIAFQDVALNQGVVLEEFEVIEYSMPLIDKDGGSSGSTVSVSGSRVSRSDIQRLPARSVGSAATAVGGSSSYAESADRIAAVVEAHLAVAMSENVAHLEYLIDVPFTVRSDGRDYQLQIKEASLDASYVYHAVPKLDADAFLTADIADWGRLNILPGQASVYYQGTFTGHTHLHPQHTGDTLSISLGRDRGIVVQRVGNRALNDRRFVGSTVRETQSWELSLRNKHRSTVKVVLYDQYPVSELKSVQVSLNGHDAAEVDERTGALRWEIQMEPGALERRSFSYELKYPQGSTSMVR